MSGSRSGMASATVSMPRNASGSGAFGGSIGINKISSHASSSGKHHSSTHNLNSGRFQGSRKVEGSFGLKSNNGLSGGLDKFGLPPPPDEDDDLLRHYASPKRNWEPLPLDLFPRPNAEQERQDSARFPCSKYYELTKYTLEEARLLSAMDIIPKDSLKQEADQPSRTKRLKRTTTEGSGIAGYYRYKNEGVEVLYGSKSSSSSGVTAQSQQARLLKRYPSGHEASHLNNAEKSMPPAVIYKSIVAPSRLEGMLQQGGNRSSDRLGTGHSAKERSAPSPQPKKQGNRLDWVGLPGLKQAYNHGLSGVDTSYGQGTGRPSASSSGSSLASSSNKRSSQPSTRSSAAPTETRTVSKPAVKSFPNKNRVVVSKPKSKPKDVEPNEDTGGSSGTMHDTSSSMDEERLAAEALGVMAHEELGASDDEDMLAGF